ncbi:hypothetical protein KXW38_001879, partial [Aspergillus fumigatus]
PRRWRRAIGFCELRGSRRSVNCRRRSRTKSTSPWLPSSPAAARAPDGLPRSRQISTRPASRSTASSAMPTGQARSSRAFAPFRRARRRADNHSTSGKLSWKSRPCRAARSSVAASPCNWTCMTAYLAFLPIGSRSSRSSAISSSMRPRRCRTAHCPSV